MPYIERPARERLEAGGRPESAGELNYAITRIVDQYLVDKGGVRYAHLNEVVGALECAKLEVYRRLAAPYEDEKIREAGDVYHARPPESGSQPPPFARSATSGEIDDDIPVEADEPV